MSIINILGRLSALAFGVLTSLQLSAGVMVSDAYIRGLPPGQEVTAAFFSMTNESEEDCSLIGASSPISGAAEIHTHLHEDGVMKMRRLDSVLLPVGQAVVFKPGGRHLMLFGVRRVLVDGEKLSLTLFFKGCPEKIVDVEVRSVLR